MTGCELSFTIEQTYSALLVEKSHHIAIVGATGAVGVELLRVLERRAFPVASLRLLASERSAGKRGTFSGNEITVEALRENSFRGIDLVFFSAGGSIARDFAPAAQHAGAI